MDQSSSKDKKSKQVKPPEPKEQEDFYLEDGMVIFTEQYLLKRGSCCYCGCRHCPYRKHKKDKNSSRD
jgi:hypothetical protein